MKKQNWLIVIAVVLFTALPLWLVPKPGIGPDGKSEEAFAGSDNKAQALIGEIAPDYQRWLEPLLTPASSQIESLLFALQAAIGAGIIGYWLGTSVARERLRKEAGKTQPEKDARAD
jgi:cobalt/nickel transport protein